MRFVSSFVDREAGYALGVEQESATAYLSIPVSNTLTDYEEYYALTEAEYDALLADAGLARAFAESCRRREQDERLILKPGTDRGEPW
ncbi:hypothetical protein [Microbacterium awajiense]|uniref:hypothetical protein n=1 Tax=Microbacterium awajiense TaxID=415214 RepID=UPI0031E06BA4